MRILTDTPPLLLLAIIATSLIAFGACSGDQPGLTDPDLDSSATGEPTEDSASVANGIDVAGDGRDTLLMLPGDTVLVGIDDKFEPPEASTLRFEFENRYGELFIYEQAVHRDSLAVWALKPGTGHLTIRAIDDHGASAEFWLMLEVQDPGCPPAPTTYDDPILPLEGGDELVFDYLLELRPGLAHGHVDHYGQLKWKVGGIKNCNWQSTWYGIDETFDGFKETTYYSTPSRPESTAVVPNRWSRSIIARVTRDSVYLDPHSPPGIPITFPASASGDTLTIRRRTHGPSVAEGTTSAWQMTRSSGLEKYAWSHVNHRDSEYRSLTRVHDEP